MLIKIVGCLMEQELIEKIAFYQEKLSKKADYKNDPLQDKEIYEISCILDKLIVEFMRIKKGNTDSPCSQ